jgi:N-methylhydantoinase A
VHAPALAADLDIPAVLVPRYPGVLAALGLFAANIEHDQKITCMQRAIDVVPEALESTYRELEAACLARMKSDGIAPEQCRIARLADLRYRGQSNEMETSVGAPVTRELLAGAIADFHARHRRMYSYTYADSRVEFVNAKVVVSHAMPKFAFDRSTSGEATGRPYATRHAYFDVEAVRTDVYRRGDLVAGRISTGPAIVEQPDTTLVVPPGQSFHLDEHGNIVVRADRAARGRGPA